MRLEGWRKRSKPSFVENDGSKLQEHHQSQYFWDAFRSYASHISMGSDVGGDAGEVWWRWKICRTIGSPRSQKGSLGAKLLAAGIKRDVKPKGERLET